MVSRTKKKNNNKIIKKIINKTRKIKKADCVLGYIDKNGLAKENINNFNNDFNCLIAGHKPCLLHMNHHIKNLPKYIKNKLIEKKAKIYKNNVIYIYPKYKKQAVLLEEIANNNQIVISSLESAGLVELNKRHYVCGILLGYRNNEIRGYYLRLSAFYYAKLSPTLMNPTNNEKIKLEERIKEELKRFDIPLFNKTMYKELKTVCDKWLKMALGKDSIFNDLYEKADADIKMLEVS
jgi:hypothetical protein